MTEKLVKAKRSHLTTAIDEVMEFFPYGWPRTLGVRKDQRVAVVPPTRVIPGRVYRVVNFDLKALTAGLEEVPSDEEQG